MSRRPVRSAAAAFLGTTFEWYDFFAYGTAAGLVFPKVFFDEIEGTAGVLVSMATFSVAWLLRPLGGIVFGHFGDRRSRTQMLVITLGVMGVATVLIGLLPSYKQIGVAAPLLLVLLRMAQGFALGGEWGGAALIAVENAPSRHRGLFGSAQQVGLPAGLLLSSGVLAIVSQLPDAEFFAWGWRVPFLASVVLLAIGLFVRLGVGEPETFQQVKRNAEVPKLPLAEVLRSAKRVTFLLVFVQAACNVGYYLATVYSTTYVTDVLELPRSWVVNGLMIAAVVDLVAQPLFAMLSDKVGRRPVYLFGSLFLGACAFPFFWLADTRSLPLLWLGLVLLLGIGHASTGSLNSVLYSEQYPTRLRYTGSSFAYQVSSLVTSTPVPIVATALVAATGSTRLVSVYLVIAAGVSALCILLLRETYRTELAPVTSTSVGVTPRVE